MPRPVLIPALLALLWPCAFCSGDGLAQVIGYVSSLDQSVQQYGIYLPAAPAPSPAGYPAILHMHGYGWSVSAGFSDFQKRWAEDHGWVLINLNARGPQFYEGVGDVETRNVVRDAHERFGLDLGRLFLTGGSMGGTGAYRMGMRYPDLFAAAVGVDGWSDYREWHTHWYARTDQHSDIEEFRRPLLEAISPLYWAGRARWNAIQTSVSGNVVLPENGLLLSNALGVRAQQTPGAYTNRLFLDHEAGHGGSTRLDQIYEYFLHRQTPPNPPSFLCETPLLAHGQMYWGSMLRLKVQGASAALEATVDPGTPAIATVLTRNLSRIAVHLQASPAAEAQDVALYVDGFLAYQGPPRTVTLQADFPPKGDLWGWAEPASPSAFLTKTPELEGPLGEAFKQPFLVAYGTDGAPEQVRRNRREAEDFARGWNGFMVHADAVAAVPEERVQAADVASKSLVMFGTEQSSRLLREANARRELPVHITDDAITVADPQWGDRTYRGSQYGAFLCFPNPLCDFRQYLVVCRGQWATKPDGSARQGLEYDLEKLPWAYSDYVVFDADQRELPHVLNVNNKPPVTCYEAGYFVEAGYFDQDWQPYRAATLDRVRAQGLPTRLVHVEQLRPSATGLQVLIADASGTPVSQARVTVNGFGSPPVTASAVTDAVGWATFPALTADTPAGVVNVMATGAEYDWQADRVSATGQGGIGLAARAAAPDENGRARVTLDLSSDHPDRLSVRLLVPVGEVDQPVREVALAEGQGASVALEWRLPGVPDGTYRALAEVTASRRPVRFSRPVFVTVGSWADSPLRVTELVPADLGVGAAWQVAVRVTNFGTTPETVTVRLTLPTDRCYPEPQSVTLEPGKETTVTFRQAPGTPPLEQGLHPVRAYVQGHRGAAAYAEFTVK